MSKSEQELIRIRRVLEAINVNLTEIARAMQPAKTPGDIFQQNKTELVTEVEHLSQE